VSRSYVVAFDGGDRGQDALSWAAVLARSLDVELDAVVVVRTTTPSAAPTRPWAT
jgi:nucleotide-binding universal stress UspA family protein